MFVYGGSTEVKRRQAGRLRAAILEMLLEIGDGRSDFPEVDEKTIEEVIAVHRFCSEMIRTSDGTVEDLLVIAMMLRDANARLTQGRLVLPH